MTIEFGGRGATTGRAEKRSSVGKWDERRKEKNSQRQRHPAQQFIILPAATEQRKRREANLRKGGRGLLFAFLKSPTRLVTAVASGQVHTCVQYIPRITYLIRPVHVPFFIFFRSKSGAGVNAVVGFFLAKRKGCKGRLSRGQVGFKGRST